MVDIVMMMCCSDRAAETSDKVAAETSDKVRHAADEDCDDATVGETVDMSTQDQSTEPIVDCAAGEAEVSDETAQNDDEIQTNILMNDEGAHEIETDASISDEAAHEIQTDAPMNDGAAHEIQTDASMNDEAAHEIQTDAPMNDGAAHEIQTDALMNDGAAHEIPVSYTHLTLPTILRV